MEPWLIGPIRWQWGEIEIWWAGEKEISMTIYICQCDVFFCIICNTSLHYFVYERMWKFLYLLLTRCDKSNWPSVLWWDICGDTFQKDSPNKETRCLKGFRSFSIMDFIFSGLEESIRFRLKCIDIYEIFLHQLQHSEMFSDLALISLLIW